MASTRRPPLLASSVSPSGTTRCVVPNTPAGPPSLMPSLPPAPMPLLYAQMAIEALSLSWEESIAPWP